MEIPDKLRFLSVISKDGNFSEVLLCENAYFNNRKEAVKLIKIENIEEAERIMKIHENLFEASVLEHLGQCDYVVKVYDAEILATGFRINMEYLEKGSVQDLLNKQGYLESRSILRIAECILHALEHTHNKQILHLDIKPGNILIENENIYKLSDFGLSGIKDQEGVSKFRHIYNMHRPPENFDTAGATEQSDIYMFGMTLYRIFNGDSILSIQRASILSDADFIKAIKSGKFPDRKGYLPHVHPKFKRIINNCLQVDLNKRYKTVRAIRADFSKIKITYDWKIVQDSLDLLHWNGYKNGLLVFEILCEKNTLDLWKITFFKVGKTKMKVSEKCCKDLSRQHLYQKLEVIFTELF